MSATQYSRSVSYTSLGNLDLAPSFPFYDFGFDGAQSWRVAQSLSSGCKEIKQSSILQSQVLRKPKLPLAVRANAKLTPSRSIRVTGLPDQGMNRDIVHKKHCTTIWASNYWSTGSRGLMRVSWLVSKPISPAIRSLTSAMGQHRRSDGYGPPCCCCPFGLFIDSRLPQGSGKSYRLVPSVFDLYTIA
jgi:hypothetical protein